MAKKDVATPGGPSVRFSADHAELLNVNMRKELHGEESVTVVDLSLSALVPVDVLDELHPGCAALWRSTLWHSDGRLAETGVENLAFKRKFTGQRLVLSAFSANADDPNDQEFPDAKADKWVVEPKPGHQMELTWRVQTTIEEGQLEWLEKRFLVGSVNVEFRKPRQVDMVDEVERQPEPAKPRKRNGSRKEAAPDELPAGHQSFPGTLDGTSKSPLDGGRGANVQ